MPLVTTAELVRQAARAVAASRHSTSSRSSTPRASSQATAVPAPGDPAGQREHREVPRRPDPAAGGRARRAGLRRRFPVSLHLDHVEAADLWREAAKAGYSSVMVDCGSLPYEQNVAITADVTALLHGQGLAVEAELGYVGGKDSQAASAHAPGVRTDRGRPPHSSPRRASTRWPSPSAAHMP